MQKKLESEKLNNNQMKKEIDKLNLQRTELEKIINEI